MIGSQQFRPAIEKGIIEAAGKGAIAGYPLVDFKVQLVDGSYHALSTRRTFIPAPGLQSFSCGNGKGEASLLEPIMDVEIAAPQEHAATSWEI